MKLRGEKEPFIPIQKFLPLSTDGDEQDTQRSLRDEYNDNIDRLNRLFNKNLAKIPIA